LVRDGELHGGKRKTRPERNGIAARRFVYHCTWVCPGNVFGSLGVTPEELPRDYLVGENFGLILFYPARAKARAGFTFGLRRRARFIVYSQDRIKIFEQVSLVKLCPTGLETFCSHA